MPVCFSLLELTVSVCCAHIGTFFGLDKGVEIFLKNYKSQRAGWIRVNGCRKAGTGDKPAAVKAHWSYKLKCVTVFVKITPVTKFQHRLAHLVLYNTITAPHCYVTKTHWIHCTMTKLDVLNYFWNNIPSLFNNYNGCNVETFKAASSYYLLFNLLYFNVNKSDHIEIQRTCLKLGSGDVITLKGSFSCSTLEASHHEWTLWYLRAWTLNTVSVKQSTLQSSNTAISTRLNALQIQTPLTECVLRFALNLAAFDSYVSCDGKVRCDWVEDCFPCEG